MFCVQKNERNYDIKIIGALLLKTVVLITCTRQKHKGIHEAEYLYSASPNFVRYLSSARSIVDDSDIFIVSALHHLVPLHKTIEDYDCALTERTVQEQFAWGELVAKELSEIYDLDKTRFIVIADDDYCSALLPYLKHMDKPLNGVGCGPAGYEQLDSFLATQRRSV